VGRLEVLVSASQAQELILLASDGSNCRTMRCAAGGFFISAPAWAGPDEVVYVQSLAVTGGDAPPAGGARLVKQNIRSGKWETLMNLPHAALAVDVAGSGTVILDAMSPRQNLTDLPLLEKPTVEGVTK
jgi:hypothetical protein